jgi:O-antigen/teichoic acid export membrane protein
MPARSSVASSTAATFVFSVLAAGVSLASVLIVSRTLGPTGRGEIVFLMTMATLTSRLAQLGVQEANVNFASADPRYRPRLATNSFVLALVFGLAAGALVYALAVVAPAFGGHSDPILRAAALASIPILVVQPSLLRLIHADYRFALGNVSTLVQPVATLVLNGGLATAGRLTVGTALLAWIVGWFGSVLLLALYVHMRLAGFGRADRALARRTLGFGLKTHLGRVMAVGNYRLDQWFVGSLSGSRELGLYSIAVAWFEALTYLPTALAIVLRPDLVRAGTREASRRTAAAFRVSAVVTAVFVGSMILLAPFLCVTVFGEEFRGSIDDLRILALGGFGLMAQRIVGSALTAQRQPLLETAAIGAGLVFTVAFDVILIPPYGGAGAAAASVIAYSAAGVAIVALFVRALGTRWNDLAPRVDDVRLLLRAAARLRP